MFNKDFKVEIKEEILIKVFENYKERKNELEKECKEKYKEYIEVRTELKTTEMIIANLKNDSLILQQEDWYQAIESEDIKNQESEGI